MPVDKWYNKHPNENKSLFGVKIIYLLLKHSGAKYDMYGVINLYSFISKFCIYENKKSEIFKLQNSSNIKFDGLKSPKHIFLLCIYINASIIYIVIYFINPSSNLWSSFNIVSKLPPGRYSYITQKWFFVSYQFSYFIILTCERSYNILASFNTYFFNDFWNDFNV